MTAPVEDLRILLDAMPVAAMIVGHRDEVLHANAAMLRLLAADDGAGTGPAARARRLPGAIARSMPCGSCVLLPQAAPGAPTATDLQTQRLASIGFMVAGVCHEVSNPLAAVHSMVQILRSGRGVTAETVENGLDSIATNVSRVLEITRKLGDFSRTSGEALVDASIDDAMQEAIALLRQRTADVRVVYRGGPGAIVLARPGELQQVFFNLLLNAAQAMQGAGTIDAGLQPSGDERICIYVRDHGPGIPEAHLARVFDPFFTTKSPGQGTGLGLALCYEIVHALDGTIQAENHPGGGACLSVWLPRRRPG